MPLSDFDPLLGELAIGFGEPAIVRARDAASVPHIIDGRFIIDPYDVPQSPAEQGLNVTQTKFYYDQRTEYAMAGPGIFPPVIHDKLIIRGTEYEIVKIDRDDLGEHALSLLMVGAA
jgi:hypothetical protein